MRWKDYLYFQKGDKIAIILLLVLIAISGGVYILTERRQGVNVGENVADTEEEFVAFLGKLKDKEAEAPEQLRGQAVYHYPYQKKLKIGETVELNSADTSDLKMIPKIGSGYASRIVKYREALGGYIDVSQLKEVWGMDDYLYNDILPYIKLEPNNKKLKVNSLDLQGLSKHPYINYKQALVIVDIRERKGNITSINRLSLLDEFTATDLEKLSPYLSFD